MKLVAYLAMPYNAGYGRTIEENIRNAEAIAIELWRMGYAVICPHLNTAHFEKYGLDDKIFADGYLELVGCGDIQVMGTNWRQSSGAINEGMRSPDASLIFEWPNVPLAADLIEE